MRPIYELDEVAVVAHRTATARRESVAATTILTRSVIEGLPARKLPDVLRYVPGLVFVDRDGAGELSMAIARGFFGGGETEYVIVTVDDVPINDLRTGAVEWTQIPVAAIERIEVLRGAGSTVYGDAAMGAVVNIVTESPATSAALAGRVRGGAWEDVALAARTRQRIGDASLALGAAVDRGSGYRSHSESNHVSSSARYTRNWNRTVAYVTGYFQRIQKEDPGPLPSELAKRDPLLSNPLYDSDRRRTNDARLGLGLRRELKPGHQLSGDLRLQAVRIDETSTLLLAPSFGDTQLNEEDDLALWTRLQYNGRMGSSAIVAGTELERAGYDSRYSDPADQTSPLTADSGDRTKIGLYSEAQRLVAGRWRLYAGLRFDAIAARHDALGASTWFDQWSPRVGLNLSYLAEERRAGNFYAAWTRAFKAPTLSQLYDERQIPTGQPDVTINISNSDLLPQRSTGLEVGVLQRLPIGSDLFQVELALTAYRLDLEDEIDFDLSTFRFGNILESRHDGIELSLTAYLLPRLALTHSSTFMDVTFRGAEYEGNRLKNIPSTAMSNSARLLVGESGWVTLAHYFAGRVYLDDANTRSLPGGSTFDASLRWSLGRAQVDLTARNLADAGIDRVGFLLFDPVTSDDVEFVYPAGGRYLQAAISFGY
ncbi:MAG: TonB-dependent receptor [Gemmatimonadota bacterium]